MNREYPHFLQDIIEAITAIEGFVGEIDYSRFVTNREKLYATEFALQMIGEAVGKLPLSLTN